MKDVYKRQAEYEGHFSDGTVDCVEQLGRYSRMMHKLLA